MPSNPAHPASAVLMIRPAAFSNNAVTQPTNRFQNARERLDAGQLARAAVREFDALVAALCVHGIDVYAFPGRTTSKLPDEIFPNNWLTTHPDGMAVIYPLLAWNRRQERRRDILEQLQLQTDGFRISRVVDLSFLEANDQYLEGSGSLVFDHANQLAYANLSPRTHVEALKTFARKADYDVIVFDARDRDGQAIYHTNVMMALGQSFAVICLESIAAADQRFRVLGRLERSGREVINITQDQLHSFVGNMLELRGSKGNVIVLSQQAHAALTEMQIEALERHASLVPVAVDTIEANGGGSVRCMLAELFLPRKARMRGSDPCD
jgi:hypothetical protein